MRELTQDQLIAKAVELKCRIAQQTSDLKELQKLIEERCTFPEGRQTAHIFGAGYDVTVQQRTNTKWDQKKLEEARKAMGNDEFFKVFAWEFKPQSAKQLDAFLSFGSSDHARLVLDARTVTKGASQFTYQPMGADA